jgi:hypothetical protein
MVKLLVAVSGMESDAISIFQDFDYRITMRSPGFEECIVFVAPPSLSYDDHPLPSMI